MAEIKARIPRELTDEKYDEWFTGFVTWFLARPDTPENCNWLRDGLQALDDDYFAKRIVAQQADDTQMDASAAWRSSVKALRLLLIKLRISLLSLVPGDDSVLHLFRIDEEVPEDPDTLVDYATIADLAWQPHAAEPEYAVFAPRLNNIAPFCDDVKTKRIAMRQAITAFSHASDEKTAAREACNTRERAIFSFFRGEDMPDGFWTDSMWGLPSGGEEEPGPTFPAAVTGLKAAIDELGNIRIEWFKYGEDVLFNLYKGKAKIGDPPPERPAVPEMANLDVLSYTDTDLQNNNTYYYWVVAVKEGEEGNFGDAVMVEYKKE